MIPLFVRADVAAAPTPGPPKVNGGGSVYAKPGFCRTTWSTENKPDLSVVNANAPALDEVTPAGEGAIVTVGALVYPYPSSLRKTCCNAP